MSDAVHIQNGARPWLPTPETTAGRVLHRYDIPLVGTFTQDGVLFLYWCVTGHAAPENAWAYARINDEDVEALARAEEASFDNQLRAVVGDHACTFAVASDEKGIIASVTLNPPATFDTVHRVGMTEIGDRFRELFVEYQALQERFPLLHSAATFNLAPSPV